MSRPQWFGNERPAQINGTLNPKTIRRAQRSLAYKRLSKKQEKYAIEQGVQITPMAVALGYGFHAVSDDARYVFSVNGVVKVLTRSIGRNVKDTSAVSSESESDYVNGVMKVLNRSIGRNAVLSESESDDGDEYDRGQKLKSMSV